MESGPWLGIPEAIVYLVTLDMDRALGIQRHRIEERPFFAALSLVRGRAGFSSDAGSATRPEVTALVRREASAAPSTLPERITIEGRPGPSGTWIVPVDRVDELATHGFELVEWPPAGAPARGLSPTGLVAPHFPRQQGEDAAKEADYTQGEKWLTDLLRSGLPAVGYKQPNGPPDPIHAAEFTTLSLSRCNAVVTGTDRVVWPNLQVRASTLVAVCKELERKAQNTTSGQAVAPPLPETPPPAAPVAEAGSSNGTVPALPGQHKTKGKRVIERQQKIKQELRAADKAGELTPKTSQKEARSIVLRRLRIPESKAPPGFSKDVIDRIRKAIELG
jgi:hypothetical protein